MTMCVKSSNVSVKHMCLDIHYPLSFILDASHYIIIYYYIISQDSTYVKLYLKRCNNLSFYKYDLRKFSVHFSTLYMVFIIFLLPSYVQSETNVGLKKIFHVKRGHMKINFIFLNKII